MRLSDEDIDRIAWRVVLLFERRAEERRVAEAKEFRIELGQTLAEDGRRFKP